MFLISTSLYGRVNPSSAARDSSMTCMTHRIPKQPPESLLGLSELLHIGSVYEFTNLRAAASMFT